MKILLALILTCLPHICLAQVQSFEILNPQVKQGDTLIIRINPQWQVAGVGILLEGANISANNLGYVFVGIGVDVKPERHSVFLTEYGVVRMDIPPVEFEVQVRNFSEWFRGSVPIPSRVVRERLLKDRQLKESAYILAESFEDLTSGEYNYPLDTASVTNEFGNRRLYGRRRNKPELVVPHGGIDLRAPLKTKIKAINSGKVLLARRMLADGNLLILDHGSGIISMYLHLSRFTVKEGENIKTGQVVAYSGNTGGVPPHLDFRIKVHDTYIDPLEFIKIYNEKVAP